MLEAVEVELTLAVLSVTVALAVVEMAASQQILTLVEVPELPILVAEVEAELCLLQHPMLAPAAQAALAS
jgi:GTPase